MTRSRPAGRPGTTPARTPYAAHHVDLAESRVRKLLALLETEPRGRLLDLGGAGGELAAALAERGWKVTAVEREAALAAAAMARGIDVSVVDVDVAPLPFDTGVFDAAVAGEVIEHVVDTDHVLAEIARVLRPAGCLVITTPNLASFENRIRLLCGRYPMWMDHRVAGAGHLRYYTPPVLKRHLETHGFRVEHHVGNWVPLLPQRWVDDRRWPWLAKTGDWWPSLAMSIVMKARRC